MVIDTSALAAIAFVEPDRELYLAAIAENASVSMSSATLVESGLVIEGRLGREGGHTLRQYLTRAEVHVVPVDERQADLAMAAWRRFGKGRHPAALNLGDCFSYALAQALDAPLLFKGEDFAQTDIRSARH